MIEVNKPQILIVEDAVEVVEILRIAFRKTNLELHHCPSGPEALNYLDTHTPDLIILDIALPGMSGWDLLDIIREEGGMHDTPVVVLTSYTDSANRKTGRLRNVFAYFSKPINLDELRAAINSALHLN